MNRNTLRAPVSSLSGKGTSIVPTVEPSSRIADTGVAVKSVPAVAASWLAGMLLLGATIATPVTWMVPVEP